MKEVVIEPGSKKSSGLKKFPLISSSTYGQKHANYTIQSGFGQILIGVSCETSLAPSTVFANTVTTNLLQTHFAHCHIPTEMTFCRTLIVSLTNCLLTAETRYLKNRAFNQALVITTVDVRL